MFGNFSKLYNIVDCKYNLPMFSLFGPFPDMVCKKNTGMKEIVIYLTTMLILLHQTQVRSQNTVSTLAIRCFKATCTMYFGKKAKHYIFANH